jgi:hypothetical protein
MNIFQDTGLEQKLAFLVSRLYSATPSYGIV